MPAPACDLVLQLVVEDDAVHDPEGGLERPGHQVQDGGLVRLLHQLLVVQGQLRQVVPAGRAALRTAGRHYAQSTD